MSDTFVVIELVAVVARYTRNYPLPTPLERGCMFFVMLILSKRSSSLGLKSSAGSSQTNSPSLFPGIFCTHVAGDYHAPWPVVRLVLPDAEVSKSK
jgi:hypothetical protein